MRIRTTKNEYGQPEAHYICQECGRDFSITPAPTDDTCWTFCYDKDCFSYDPKLEIKSHFQGLIKAHKELEG
jgi:hypothetical protein